jgi:hypothetical protein
MLYYSVRRLCISSVGHPKNYLGSGQFNCSYTQLSEKAQLKRRLFSFSSPCYLVGSEVPMALKRVGKKARRSISPGTLIRTGPIFTAPRMKDECQSSRLAEEFQQRAADAYLSSTLFMLEGKLRCNCGAMVGAEKSPTGDWFRPTRHTVYKEPRPPAHKRDPFPKR